MLKFKFIILLFLNFILQFCKSDILLQTPNGEILGSVNKTQFNNNTYHAFKGIRYGNAGRFELAKPAKPWKGVYNATFERPTCIQLDKTDFPESDDCFFLNVYVPKIFKNSSSLPVIFWVFGGSFLDGDYLYRNFGPDYLLDENVIVVTSNFRLGIFGFLSTGDKILPGNLALKDVILGLQWVQDNIKFFGGDPKNVTIFGQSSGAIMASYLTLSPLTQGLFKGAILQSANALAPFSFLRNPMEVFIKVAKSTPCILSIPGGPKTVLDCLKKLSPSTLRNATNAVLGKKPILFLHLLTDFPFVPVLEKPSKTAVVTTPPYALLLQNKTKMVPMIVGINSEETLAVNDYLSSDPATEVLIDVLHGDLLPKDTYISNTKNKAIARQTIQNFYFKKQPLVNASRAEIIRFMSDFSFVKEWRQYLTMVETKTPTYCHIFSYSSEMGYNGNRTYFDGLGKVGHAEDLNYIWRNAYSQRENFPEHDYVVRKRMVRMWTNFAKFGNPTPGKEEVLENVTWHTSNYKGANNNCMNIGYNLNETQNFNEEAYRMWKNIYDTFGNPKDTY